MEQPNEERHHCDSDANVSLQVKIRGTCRSLNAQANRAVGGIQIPISNAGMCTGSAEIPKSLTEAWDAQYCILDIAPFAKPSICRCRFGVR